MVLKTGFMQNMILLYYFDVGFSLYRSILMSLWVLISDVNYKPTAKPQRSANTSGNEQNLLLVKFFIIIFSKIIFKYFHLIKTNVF